MVPGGKAERSITTDERVLALALNQCRFRKSSSADRRFCHDLVKMISAGKEVALTDGQRAYLWRIGYRYRLQLLLHVPPRLFGRVERSQRRPPPRHRPPIAATRRDTRAN
jgi:hypothetical protein